MNKNEIILDKTNYFFAGEGRILVHELGCRWHICNYSSLDIHRETYQGLCGKTIEADQIIKCHLTIHVCDECMDQATISPK